MLQSKKANFILSLVLAIALWVYVVGEMNPDTIKQFRDIPITITNEKILTEDGLAVASVSEKSLNVTLEGKRSVLSKLRSSDIVATVDVSEAAKGKNQLKIDLKLPHYVDVESQSHNRVTVKVESRVSEEREVKVTYTGDEDASTEPTTISIDPETVTVSGVSSQVNKVAYVKSTVNSDAVKNGETTVSSRLTAVNKSGKAVDNVSLSQKNANVTSILYYTKTVGLDVPIKGGTDEEYERTVTAPKEITIKGEKSRLDDSSKVKADTVDVSNIYKDTKILVRPRLVNGVTVATESRELYVKVKVKALQSSKNMTISSDSINIEGLEDGQEAIVTSGDIQVVATGSAKDVATLKDGDVTALVNAKNLGVGSHSVKATLTCSVDGVKLKTETAGITVKIIDNTEEE